MPTPMPIIAATWGAKSGVVRKLAMMPTPASEMTMPTIAVRIGRPIAMTDPNAMSSTTIAARMPTTSLAGMPPSLNQFPANSTCTPSLARGAASAFTSSAVCFGCVPEPDAVVIGAIAILPPRDTWIGSTSMTPFTCSTFAR